MENKWTDAFTHSFVFFLEINIIQFLGHGRVEIPVKHPSERTEQAFEYLGLVCREEIWARDKIWESNTNTWYLKL